MADSASGNDKANPVFWFATGDHFDELLHSPVLENVLGAIFAFQSKGGLLERFLKKIAVSLSVGRLFKLPICEFLWYAFYGLYSPPGTSNDNQHWNLKSNQK